MSRLDGEYSEGLGVIIGLIVVLILLGWAFHLVLSLHPPPQPLGPPRPAAAVATTTTVPNTEPAPTEPPLTAPTLAGVVLEYHCPAPSAVTFTVGDAGWTRTGDPVLHPAPTTAGLTRQALLGLFATACTP